MGSFADRTRALQESELNADDEPELVTLSVSSSFPIRVSAEPAFYDAIANTRVGQKVKLGRVDTDHGIRIGVVNEAAEFIGWLPSDDPVVARLLSGDRYRAEVRQLVRGSAARRFLRVVVEVSIAHPTKLLVPV